MSLAGHENLRLGGAVRAEEPGSEPSTLVPESSRVKLGPWDITDMALFGADRRRGQDLELRGSGVSAGRVRGPVRVLRSVRDGLDARPGDVLVVSQLTPAWASVLARVAAVVTDVGGSLSHGSIVARELGVPAVMGTGNATRVLGEGQVVDVDGTAGTVRPVEPGGRRDAVRGLAGGQGLPDRH